MIIMMQSTQPTVQITQYEATQNSVGHMHQCLQVTPSQFSINKQVFPSESSGFIKIQEIDIRPSWVLQTRAFAHAQNGG